MAFFCLIMLYSLSDIQKITGGRWLQQSNTQARVRQLLYDSRQATNPHQTLFFAFPGERHDGHQYLAALYRAGFQHFVVSEQIDLKGLVSADVLLVPDTRAALQTLAAHHRAQFHIPVIGITGSNGKTVVKEWLYQLLQDQLDIVRSPKSYNSQIGVPISVWAMEWRHALGIFEAGISQAGEMENLARVIQPTLGIFTNLGPAHREGFFSEKEKVREKMRLFDTAKKLVYCRDYPEIDAAARFWAEAKSGRSLYSWSQKGLPANLQVQDIQKREDGSAQITAEFSGEQVKTIVLPFSDAASIENAVHCWAMLQVLHRKGYLNEVEELNLEPLFHRLEPVEMRLELKAALNRCVLVNDAYSNDLASLHIALQFAARQARNGPLTLILSDILQSGIEENALYEEVAKALLEHRVSRFIGIGSQVKAVQAWLPAGFDAHFYPDTETFLHPDASGLRHDFHDEVILLKGARAFAFERIARRLEQKAHKTVLEINLSALVHNLKVYNRLLRPGIKMLVMVKAAGYGSGAAEVARLLEFHSVDYLGVAYADEGIELREAGVNLPILVLNPEPSSFDVLYRFRLEPEVYSLDLLEQLIRYAGQGKELSIHLKLDTGMHRLGFEAADLPALTERLLAYPNLRVQSVFSHLAASDAPGHDDFTRQQAAAFSDMAEKIGRALGYLPIRHIVNTGGIARFPEYHFDMVRLGIGIYGIDSSGLQEQLQVVNTLKATVSQVKEVQTGDTVGYNRNARVTRPSRIATISIGYADGFLRLAGNGRYSVNIHGQPAPTIGNICMDMTMVDVTNIPETREGDEVMIFGEGWPVQSLATALHTIPYEIFTNISERVKRVYWQE